MRSKALILTGVFLLGASGCATTGDFVYSTFSGPDEKEYMLKDRDKDLYIESTDGTYQKRLTFTPDVGEFAAIVARDKKHVIYKDRSGGCYIVNTDGSGRRELGINEFNSMFNAIYFGN